ncbi:protein AGENET DOMAIN (AGD)-CONTAINING P1 isoform X3 [Hevea brasiliensis]|uniref:protein AGENET DOMAIN (AGD)-CONTAINING P1 isoform X3 n=1 Tax=Hevea brasiliensis TaxID=3981 RepID=UPI0025F34D5B|nr:protein AGENET DOMAIN (AGD)-CONTAINING P1 isoform X3 [Hevea brasiliensis]
MSHLSHTHFHKGDQIEVLKLENGPNTLTYYAAAVLRSPVKQRTKILIEYQTLMIIESDCQKCVTELVDLASVRPMPPRELNKCFKMGDSVDVYCDNGWQKGTVKDILENSKYVVGFDGKSEGIVAEQCNLRLHREWDDGSWVPPLPEQNMSSPMDMKSRKVKLKIKCSKRLSEPMFRMGTRVEVKSDEEGYNGAWYGAFVVGTIGNDKFMVQYQNLVTDDETAPLREVVNTEHVRPCPPSVPSDVQFKLFEKVDAWFNEGWWEGEVSEVLYGFKYKVYFSSSNETLEFNHSGLRHHQEWNNGKWIKGKSMKLKGNKTNQRLKFCKGTIVEVKSDEVGFQGAWFSAIIIKKMGNGKFLVQYQSLLTDDGTDFLTEEASASDIRPSPPHIQHAYPFKLLEKVDAWYSDGWWFGCIIKVHKNMKYTVYFQATEELEFHHSELRPHQEWIDGRWVASSKNQDWPL